MLVIAVSRCPQKILLSSDDSSHEFVLENGVSVCIFCRCTAGSAIRSFDAVEVGMH